MNAILERPELSATTEIKTKEIREAWATAIPEVLCKAEHWCDLYNSSPEARFVLEPALRLRLLNAIQSAAFRRLALSWLSRYRHLEEKVYVLAPLIGRPDLEEIELREVLPSARQWLESFGQKPEGNYLINALLEQSLLDPASLLWTISIGLDWLKANPAAENRDFIINRVLKHARLLASEVVDSLIEEGIIWLEGSYRSPSDAKRMLYRLWECGRESPSAECIELSAKRYRVSLLRRDESWTKDDLMNLTKAQGENFTSKFEQALYWVSLLDNSGSSLWTQTLEKLLGSPTLTQAQRHQVIELAYTWVFTEKNSQRADWVLLILFLLKGNHVHEKTELFALCLRWAMQSDNFQAKGWRHMFRSLLLFRDADSYTRSQLFALGLTWLSTDGPEQQDHWEQVYHDLEGIGRLSNEELRELIALRNR